MEYKAMHKLSGVKLVCLGAVLILAKNVDLVLGPFHTNATSKLHVFAATFLQFCGHDFAVI